jgi:hypothetical protein
MTINCDFQIRNFQPEINMTTTPTCLNCGRTDQQVPLLSLTFKGEPQRICPQCLPILIHKPAQLTEKLPGLEIAPPAAH